MSRQQWLCLNLLRGEAWWDRAGLAMRLDTSPKGAAQTASSLVRKGYAVRTIVRGRVHWTITPTGLDAAHLHAMRSPIGATK